VETTDSTAPWRLRDLTGRARAAAAVVALLLAVPYVAALVRAVDVAWNPSNDDALIALRVHEVLDGEWPRLGQPSTAEHYTGRDTLRHPGPIQFYLLAPVVALLGTDLGLPLGAATINLSAVLVAAWVVLRRAGPRVALGAAPLIGALAWAQGPVQLVDPVSSNMGGIPLLALVALAWAVADGDLRLLPLGALVLAFVAQQHLAVFGLAGGLGAWMALGVAVTVAGWRRAGGGHRRGGATARPGRARPARWIGAAVAVSVLAWAPVLVDQVAGSGNLVRIVTFAGSSDRPSVGFAAGLRQAARALGLPPLVLRTDLTGHDLLAPVPAVGWIASLAVLAALVAVAVTGRARQRARAALAATVLVAAVLGVVTGSNVPDSVEAGRLNLYRWTFVVSATTWITLGWAGASVVARRWRRDQGAERARVAGLTVAVPAIAAGVVLAAVSVAAVVGSGPRTWRDEEVFAAEEELSAALLAEAEGMDRLLVVPVGRSAEFAVAPALVLDLVQAGHRISVPPSQVTGYGDRYAEVADLDGAVVVVSGTGDVQDWPGRLVARVDLNAASRAARDAIADQVRGRELVVSPHANQVLEEIVGSGRSGRAEIFAAFLAGLADDPDTVLRHPLAGRALAAGYFSSPELDPAATAELAAHPPVENWHDDVIEVRLLDRDELEEHRDALMAVGLGRPVG
jgi:hypothetical protein